MGSRWPHLAARFLDVVTARPLDPRDRAWVEGRLREAESALFFAQPAIDQRHGLESAIEVDTKAPDRPELVRAALLHDVGKRHVALGVIGRVWATLVLWARPRTGGRIGAYGAHGRLAAAELETVGSEPLVVAFARHHHDARPSSFPAGDWSVLTGADRARIRHRRPATGYPRASTTR